MGSRGKMKKRRILARKTNADLLDYIGVSRARDRQLANADLMQKLQSWTLQALVKIEASKHGRYKNVIAKDTCRQTDQRRTGTES